MVHSQTDIHNALQMQSQEFTNYIKPLPQAAFEDMPGGKWGAGQHLDHLIKSIKPVNLAFSLPGFVLQYKFGKNNRNGRTYNELLQRYHDKLQGGGVAAGPFVPPVISYNQQQAKLAEFTKQYDKLAKKALGKSDAQLDTYLVPHPLLGKVTLREILFFTIFHTQIHLDILKGRE